jgi:hypothetical protein
VARRALGVALATAALFGPPANAQTLALLHVRSFVLAADKTSVAVGEQFHMTLTAHVDERIESIDNVLLPSLSGFDDLGDERRCMPAKAGGTDCVEAVTLDADQPGDFELGPALFEFVDAATGRVRNMQSNLVPIHVTGTAKAPPVQAPDVVPSDSLQDLIWAGIRGLAIFLLVAIAGYALIWGYHKRPRAPVAEVALPSVVTPPPEPAAPDWATRMRELGSYLADAPNRERALAVRAQLRAHLGATERETMSDLRARNAFGGDTAVMTALGAVERAAFCEDRDVAEAAREAVPFLMG